MSVSLYKENNNCIFVSRNAATWHKLNSLIYD